MLLVGCLAAERALAQAADLEAGKTPAQIFAGTCNACHKAPRGFLKSVAASSLSSFLRQHYTTSPEMAGVLASYLISNGATDTRLSGGEKKGAKEGSKEGTKEAKQEARPPSSSTALAAGFIRAVRAAGTRPGIIGKTPQSPSQATIEAARQEQEATKLTKRKPGEEGRRKARRPATPPSMRAASPTHRGRQRRHRSPPTRRHPHRQRRQRCGPTRCSGHAGSGCWFGARASQRTSVRHFGSDQRGDCAGRSIALQAGRAAGCAGGRNAGLAAGTAGGPARAADLAIISARQNKSPAFKAGLFRVRANSLTSARLRALQRAPGCTSSRCAPRDRNTRRRRQSPRRRHPDLPDGSRCLRRA